MRIFVIIFVVLAFGCKPKKENTTPPKQEVVEPKIMVEKEILVGKFKEKNHKDFVKIPVKYADREGRYMQKEALEAFAKMYDAAQKDGIKLIIKSATRNFHYQKGIWERKWTGKTILSSGKNAAQIHDHKDRALNILEYSSMPGTSRHHWGTDIDLNAFNNQYFESGQGLKIYNWLTANAAKYGFCQPYTSKKNGREGYNEEKWHWSYMPISKDYTRAIPTKVSYSDIKGFLGDETAEQIDVISKYMLGINEECK